MKHQHFVYGKCSNEVILLLDVSSDHACLSTRQLSAIDQYRAWGTGLTIDNKDINLIKKTVAV